MDKDSNTATAPAVRPAANTAPKRDAAAAAGLADMYAQLEQARAMVKRMETEPVAVSQMIVSVGGDSHDYRAQDQAALTAAVKADASAKVKALEAQIKGLGFEA